MAHAPEPASNDSPTNGYIAAASLLLRPVTHADFEALFEFQSDPESTRMAVATSRDRGAFWSHWSKIIADPEVAVRAIVVDQRVVGNVSCFKMDGVDAIGYWIGREWWGKGIATRALTMFLASEALPRPLHAWAASSNLASRRVLEKCGFRHTGYRDAPAMEYFPACEEAIYIRE